MNRNSRYLFLLLFYCSLSPGLYAQIDTLILKKFTPPITRQLFHGYVDEEQKNILNWDGKNDNKLTISDDPEINYMVTQTITLRTDWLQYRIEKDTLLTHTKRIYYLKGLRGLFQQLQRGWTQHTFQPINLPMTLSVYERCMEMDKTGQSIADFIRQIPYDLATPVVRSGGFDENPGIKAAKDELVLKFCLMHPDQTFLILKENPDVPFADSLVRIVARRYPRQLYDYAAANNKLSNTIRNIVDDDFIRSVVRMARSKSGQQYFPFLDNIVSGKMTFESIDSVKEDSLQYYRLLVRTHMDYVARALNRDTAYEYAALVTKLETKARDVFVNTINGLHEEDSITRFRIIQSLSAEELYYLAVCTDGIIYTSSFVKGVYPLMMRRVNYRGDSLLKLLRFDRYRKFIKMAAGYNTLSSFLATFPKSTDPEEPDPANILMKAFVGKLERTEGTEDGVDVADSYASIAETIKPVADEMLTNIRANYERNMLYANKRGSVIYNILNKLFQSADTSKGIDLTKELGIPPVYEVPYKALLNDSGRVIMQVFFYGDKDGQGIFRGFTGMFSPTNWKITGTDKWVCISSIKGKPVSIYANRALPEETGEDEIAQKELCQYLEKNKLYPTITIHRGHSYYANSTIQQMFPSSKIVFLGSCGGYHLIHDVLAKAPEAHIIASKQIGKTAVNRPFFQLLTEKTRTGNNIDWIPFWKELEKMVQVEGFEDYIPPYKNLGALYIKAYQLAMEEKAN